jgi:hypothetical protein
MKGLLIVLAASAVGVASIAAAADCGDAAARVDVTFSKPEAFTDTRDRDVAPLKQYIAQRAERYLPVDTRLAVTVVDIDLAGAIEPWRPSSAGRVRMMRDVYPPRVVLDFTLSDANCKALRTGHRELSDMGYLAKNPRYSGDPLQHEKALLEDWLQREFARGGS